LDEFVVLQQYPHNHTEIRGVLNDYLIPYGGALTVNWSLFGTANKTVYAPMPVSKRFQYRERRTHHVVKSIVKTKDFKSIRDAVNVKKGEKVRTTKYPGAVLMRHPRQERVTMTDPRMSY
jgi:hypothetical protein